MTEHENPMLPDEVDAFYASHDHDLIKMFDELSFRQKWTRVCAGLKQPINSGQHKWARLQIIRLLSPIAAVLIPLLMLLLIAFLAKLEPEPKDPSFTVTLKRDEPPEEIIKPPEKPDITEPEPPEFTDVVVEDFIVEPETFIESSSPIPQNPSKVIMESFKTADRIRDVMVMNKLITTRSTDSQEKALKQHVAEHTADSVLRALRWLAKHQHADGSWGKDKPAMTAMALLAYLAHGDTPTTSKEFRDTVEKALRFLTDTQGADGRFKGRDGHDYTQPIAAYALAEAYGMTEVPQLKEAAIKAIQVVVKGQNASGSFNYGLVPGGSDRDDLSYAGWCVQALKAASVAGLDDDIPAIATATAKAIKGIKVHARSQSDKGFFGYSRGGGGSRGLTGVGVLSLQFLGEGDSPEARMGIKGMQDWAFNWKNPPTGSPLYYWYYITQAYFQSGGDGWEQWNDVFSHSLVNEQLIQSAEQSGYVDHKGQPQETGYWISPSESEHNASNDEVMDTMLCTLMLEVYYRHLPTFQQNPERAIEKELGDKEDIKIDFVAL